MTTDTSTGYHRKVLHQYGFRITETGLEQWGRFDPYYNGANSMSEADVRAWAQQTVDNAARAGVKVTAVILRREHLTTTWRRWIPGVDMVGRPVTSDRPEVSRG